MYVTLAALKEIKNFPGKIRQCARKAVEGFAGDPCRHARQGKPFGSGCAGQRGAGKAGAGGAAAGGTHVVDG